MAPLFSIPWQEITKTLENRNIRKTHSNASKRGKYLVLSSHHIFMNPLLTILFCIPKNRDDMESTSIIAFQKVH